MSASVYRFGVRASSVAHDQSARVYAELACAAESSGLDSFWVPERLIPSDDYYRFLRDGVCFEPLSVLSYVGALTSRITLGTAALVLPLREPVMLSKAVAAVHALTGSRLILGVASGWSEQEFNTVGADFAKRGPLTDDLMRVLVASLREGRIPRQRFSRDEEVDGDSPRLPMPKIWIAGGAIDPKVSKPSRLLRRIASSDGWIIPPGTSTAGIATQVPHVYRTMVEAERDPSVFTIAHVNFCHLVDASLGTCVREQETAFARFLTATERFESLKRRHWTGTLDDVATSVRNVLRAGVQHVIAHPVSGSIEQVEMWREVTQRALERL